MGWKFLVGWRFWCLEINFLVILQMKPMRFGQWQCQLQSSANVMKWRMGILYLEHNLLCLSVILPKPNALLAALPMMIDNCQQMLQSYDKNYGLVQKTEWNKKIKICYKIFLGPSQIFWKFKEQTNHVWKNKEFL